MIRIQDQRASLRFEFIRDHREQFRLSAMCRVMSASRSGFYEWLSRPESNRFREDQALKTDIKDIHEKSRKLYGGRHITNDPTNQGKSVSRRRITHRDEY